MQKNNLLYDEMILMAALYSANTLSGILIMENLRYSSENRYSRNSRGGLLEYIYYWNLQFLNNVIIIENKVLFSQF
jgi:hypothetical protein